MERGEAWSWCFVDGIFIKNLPPLTAVELET
jgi:hypothetical protein